MPVEFHNPGGRFFDELDLDDPAQFRHRRQ